jgi:hypothetical protein
LPCGWGRRTVTVRDVVDQWSVFGNGQIFEPFGDAPRG